MLTPAKSLRSFRFCTLAGVTDVRLVGEEIHGRWLETLHEYYGPHSRRLIEDFLNWPDDPEGILRFIRKYGPVDQTPPAPGEEFLSNLAVWRAAQEHLRELWQHLSKFPDWEPEGGSLAFRKGFLTYTAASLYMFLYMDTVTCSAKHVRRCKREDCPHPYFIAKHLKERFCSDVCAAWGQREWKKQWWKEHGQAWRAARRRQNQKGGKRGTHKTR
jgi:hypothetical protein